MNCFDKDLAALALKVSSMLSEKRFQHTLGVRKMAEMLADHCLPGKREEIAAAALLHDVAKEIPIEQLIDIMKADHVVLTEADAPPVFHSYAAPYVVKTEFPEFATPSILSAVARHTVGDADMSIFDEIIFLADYIEDGRTYKDCIETRELMLSSLVPGDVKGNVNALHKACIMSIDRTCKSLLEKGKAANPRALEAKKALQAKIY